MIHVYDKIHYVGIKKANNIYRKFRHISEVSDIHTTKYTFSWNKKNLQNTSEISNLLCRLFCFNLQGIFRAPHAVRKNIVYFVTPW